MMQIHFFNKLYFIGGSKFDIDKEKKMFNGLEENDQVEIHYTETNQKFKKNINGIKKIKTYSIDLDCHIYVEEESFKEFSEKVRDFYKNFKEFINKNINDNNLINNLTELVIEEDNDNRTGVDNGSWTIVKNVKKNILYKLHYLRDFKFTDYFPLQETQKEIHPIYTSFDNGYMIIDNSGKVDYFQSRPYLLLRQSIILKNGPCNFIKNPNLFELNFISKTRLFDMYNFCKDFFYNNIADKNIIYSNFIFVFLQYILFNLGDEHPNKNLQFMLYSSWLNFRMNIKPKSNLYRFVHYAKYCCLNDSYHNYVKYYNHLILDFFNQKNKDYIVHHTLNLPPYGDINSINFYIDSCNELNEDDLLNESEYTPFKCPISPIKEKELKIKDKRKIFENRLSVLDYDEDDTMKDDNLEDEIYDKFQKISLNENELNELNKINLEDKVDEEKLDDEEDEEEDDDEDEVKSKNKMDDEYMRD